MFYSSNVIKQVGKKLQKLIGNQKSAYLTSTKIKNFHLYLKTKLFELLFSRIFIIAIDQVVVCLEREQNLQ